MLSIEIHDGFTESLFNVDNIPFFKGSWSGFEVRGNWCVGGRARARGEF